MLKREWIKPSYLKNFFTMNNEHNWEDLRTQSKEINNRALPIITTKSKEV